MFISSRLTTNIRFTFFTWISALEPGDDKPWTRNQKPETMKPETRNHEPWNQKPETMKPETMKPETRNQKPWTRNQKPETMNQKQETIQKKFTLESQCEKDIVMTISSISQIN